MAPPEHDSALSEATPVDEAATRASSTAATSETASGDPAHAAESSGDAQRDDQQGEAAEGSESQPDAEPQPDHEAKVTADLDELTAQAQKADEYLELAQRTKADFENYRKRAAREAAAAQERGIAKLARELLPAVDNLDRALEAAEAEAAVGGTGEGGADSPLVSGIKLVHADVLAALSRAGIERFEPTGEPFDPQHHEAVAQQPVDGAQSGTIVEVYQRGYRIGESVLRPARVLVAQ